MDKKRLQRHRLLSAVCGSLLAAAIFSGSTLAWQSISQVALNENADVVNPGGRLHDDFNGTDKKVYVENFADEDLIVRVKLSEFMEIGADAGKAEGTNHIPVVNGTVKDDRNNWHIHSPKEDVAICKDGIHEYVTWVMGGQTTYLPTFNKNKDSLKADINGTFEGSQVGDGAHFDDYKIYEIGKSISGTEIWDADTNSIEEKSPQEGVNIMTAAGVQHQPDLTLNAEVITMEDWRKPTDAGGKGEALGAYWIYDEDGWAYWGEALKPHTATGLLLSKVDMVKFPDDNWYYAIDVVGQFATLDDIGEKDNSGFFDPVKGALPSENAKTLMGRILMSGSSAGSAEPEHPTGPDGSS